MSAITSAMETLADHIATRVGVPVTVDPGVVVPPCVFVDMPAITARTMKGWTVEVPIVIVVPGPGDLVARDSLLDLAEAVLEAVGQSEANPIPFTQGDVTYPAMSITGQLTIERTA